MVNRLDELQHNNPVWIAKADFVVGAKITDRILSKQYAYEQLAARRLSNDEYEICCIPFALYDMFLGDVVRVDKDLNAIEVVHASGHLGFRVATQDAKSQKRIAELLADAGCLIEYFSSTLLAVDVKDKRHAEEVAVILDRAEREGLIIEYETIKL